MIKKSILKTISLLCLILICQNNLFGQDYTSIRSERSASFVCPYGSYNFIVVDSVEILENDVVYYFMNNFYEEDYSCIKPDGPSFLGYNLVKKENGDNVFQTAMHEDFLIRTSANVGDTWVAYNNEDIVVNAEIVSHSQEDFLNINDSVKTIEIKVYDIDNQEIDHWLNNKIIKLSKNFGLIEIFRISTIPDVFHNDYYFGNSDYKLSGLTNSDIGVQNLTYHDVWDFEANDEIHVVATSSFSDGYSSTGEEVKTILRFLSRSEEIDTIFYSVAKTQSVEIHNYMEGEVDRTYMSDTITLAITPNSLFDKFPYTALAQELQSGNNDVVLTTQASRNGIIRKSYDNYVFHYLDDGCMDYTISHGMHSVEYYKGLGGPYYSYSDGLNESNRELVYYKKGHDTWGMPLSIVPFSDEDDVVVDSVEVFPNPFSSEFMVNVPENELPCIIEITDISGKLLFRQNLDSESNSVVLNEPLPRMILYYIHNEKKKLKAGKLFVK